MSRLTVRTVRGEEMSFTGLGVGALVEREAQVRDLTAIVAESLGLRGVFALADEDGNVLTLTDEMPTGGTFELVPMGDSV